MKKTPFQDGSVTSFDDTQIYYEVRGEGEPILFVYGIACLINHWHYQIDYFSSSCQVINFDLRGHHRSSSPEEKENLTIEAVARDILAVIDHLGIKKIHLAGHSFGAPVLLQFYELYPERVSSLIIVNGFAKNPIKEMFGLNIVEPFFHLIKANFDINPKLWNQLWQASTHNPVAMWMSGLVGGFNLKLTQFKDIEIYAKGVSQVDLEVFIPLFEDLMRFNGYSIAAKINCPTIIIAGEKDSITPLNFQQELHSFISRSELVIIPYGSHCTQLDFPDYVNLKIEKHLERAARPAALSHSY